MKIVARTTHTVGEVHPCSCGTYKIDIEIPVIGMIQVNGDIYIRNLIIIMAKPAYRNSG